MKSTAEAIRGATLERQHLTRRTGCYFTSGRDIEYECEFEWTEDFAPQRKGLREGGSLKARLQKIALLEELLGDLPAGLILGGSSLLSVPAASFSVVQPHSLVCGTQD